MTDKVKESKSNKVSTVEAGKDKKNLIVMRKEGTTLWRIGFEGGGEVPQKLAGLYTSTKVAEQAIKDYLVKRK